MERGWIFVQLLVLRSSAGRPGLKTWSGGDGWMDGYLTSLFYLCTDNETGPRRRRHEGAGSRIIARSVGKTPHG
ncbi:hypothetical protein GGS23DRAFT_91076 [Durotheca rogersii]|uniref:uncharacterized protein n=1 Tax=Durotheca rogersii TaxID=419775 RepID=UPI00221E4674|nr:uncharacterized protein GGS23DRAFT_91076 [Durotheca rogersii]KAI5850817.1 hypothetical protein GGS23DRAFT_91076 [Durotheca rogersii]